MRKIAVNGILREMTPEEEAAYAAEPMTEKEKKEAYEELTRALIAERYSASDEQKTVREYIAYGKTAEFEAYNAYVEQCKAAARLKIYGGENDEN